MENYTSKGNFFIIFDTFHPPFFRKKNNFQKRGKWFFEKIFTPDWKIIETQERDGRDNRKLKDNIKN